VKALSSWIEAAGLTSGRVFRRINRHRHVGPTLSTRTVGELVKGYAKRAGFDAADFGGHSLRAGFVTSAAERGATADRIMDHTGHRSHAMVRTYTRRSDAFSDHAGEGLL
jgi:integrase